MARGKEKLVGLNVRGKTEPDVYRVCQDAFMILSKMLAANQTIGPYSGSPQFEFSEVRFILDLLGVPESTLDEGASALVDLWISEE